MLSATKLALHIVKLLQGRRLSDPEDSVASKAPQPVKQSSQAALQSGTPVLIPAAVTPVIERFLQASRLPGTCPRHVSYVFLGSILMNIGQNFNVDYIKCMCSISCVQVECSS